MEYGYIVKYYKNKPSVGRRVNEEYSKAKIIATKELHEDSKAIAITILNESKQKLYTEVK